jgi:hypothetical protein
LFSASIGEPSDANDPAAEIAKPADGAMEIIAVCVQMTMKFSTVPAILIFPGFWIAVFLVDRADGEDTAARHDSEIRRTGGARHAIVADEAMSTERQVS